MPQPYKGRRVKLTIRLPYDVFEQAAARAEARRWNLTQYIGWCVERQLNPVGVTARERADPTLGKATPAAVRSRQRRGPFGTRFSEQPQTPTTDGDG